jgi:hypothetical protein
MAPNSIQKIIRLIPRRTLMIYIFKCTNLNWNVPSGFDIEEKCCNNVIKKLEQKTTIVQWNRNRGPSPYRKYQKYIQVQTGAIDFQ